MSRISITTRLLMLALSCIFPLAQGKATTEIILRSQYRIVLAADSRALYGENQPATECKLFEVGDVYATVSGLAHVGKSYPVTDAIREGFADGGTFAGHVSSTALALQRRVEKQIAELHAWNRSVYQYLVTPASNTSDFIQLALAQNVRGQPMLGIIELRRTGTESQLVARTTVCPGACTQNPQVFYFGYWERIKPYVAGGGQPRSVASAASIDRLIRLEADAHPREVGTPINILELTGWGARWLQNGGNCSLPGVGW